jgi:hypothetical protein
VLGEVVVSPNEARGRRGFAPGWRRSVPDAVAVGMGGNMNCWFEEAAIVADIQPKWSGGGGEGGSGEEGARVVGRDGCRGGGCVW